MKERPILFSGPMVRAILEGRKTQTRRVLKPQPWLEYGVWYLDRTEDGYRGTNAAWQEGDTPFWTYCPYGVTGDRLWVRESCWDWTGLRVPTLGFAVPPNHHMQPFICFDDHPELEAMIAKAVIQRRPSIHMPRWASRITLEITEIRVERVQSISKADAIAEGISVLPLQREDDPSAWYQSAPGVNQARSAQESYAMLWDSINKKKHPWSSNPWVWAITFTVVNRPSKGAEG